ncbi:hypothetical protein [Paenibacillus donghaensis]|uniref:Uncharacterized protein n=1 Tax=Paenibacillus donghaensis TaxID=414771 RepID=A0A2Z2KIF7_9BACL|nr:hypothetical protein [Paenibacillus donghaensis]ASA22019.1 hypothetical protein B9T62_15295 [Paenibacillus donghaensis]
MSMTPEQIEEIGMTMALLEADLLHTKKALEEAQQQLTGKTEELAEEQQQLKEMTINASGWKEQYIAEWAKRSKIERDLAEAQQTIARQREAMGRALTNLADALNFPFSESNEDTRCVKRMIDTSITQISSALANKDIEEKKSPYPTLLDTTAVLNALLARQAEEGSDKA